MVHVRGDGRTYSVACNRQLSRADGRIPCHIDTAARRAAPALDEAREKSGLQEQHRWAYRQGGAYNTGGKQYKGNRTGKDQRYGMDGAQRG